MICKNYMKFKFMSINNGLLEPSHANSFRYSYLTATMAELSTIVAKDII